MPTYFVHWDKQLERYLVGYLFQIKNKACGAAPFCTLRVYSI